MRRLMAAEYELPESASEELRDLLAQLLQPDVSKRLTAADALKHPWVLADDRTEEQVDVSVTRLLPSCRYVASTV